MQSLTVLGNLVIHQDVALIGNDDIGFAAPRVVSLSAICRPTELIGRTAVQLLTEDASHHRQAIYKPELIARARTIGRAQ
ncbi:hypothetical protein [Paenarthrobacter sp. PH39-S1]|uniref:hypothetical protein n=1 Tax=Paenarthrobacter sp. PH39-S1 TaxID=3046204 RepID=UPI0024B960F4|nr:hypothetical protein [Paenarthrobacter sp. PH39-S1]MDJ0358244.1 hypothetical protein [Paenarthrobacter sp. PH39-S1]